jgi:hypothetical protein
MAAPLVGAQFSLEEQDDARPRVGLRPPIGFRRPAILHRVGVVPRGRVPAAPEKHVSSSRIDERGVASVVQVPTRELTGFNAGSKVIGMAPQIQAA